MINQEYHFCLQGILSRRLVYLTVNNAMSPRAIRDVPRILHWEGRQAAVVDIFGGCRAIGASPHKAYGLMRRATKLCLQSASVVHVSAPIELRQGSGGAAPEKNWNFYFLECIFTIE